MDIEGHVKISDFDSSSKLTVMQDPRGTRGYQAPEVVSSQPYGREVDFWSFGCTLYAIILGKEPFHPVVKHHDLFHLLTSTTKLVFPSSMPKLAADLVKELLIDVSSKRLGFKGAEEVKKHPFLHAVDWECIVPVFKPKPYLPNHGKPHEFFRFSLGLEDKLWGWN
jgi:serine/threonine protein kinase